MNVLMPRHKEHTSVAISVERCGAAFSAQMSHSVLTEEKKLSPGVTCTVWAWIPYLVYQPLRTHFEIMSEMTLRYWFGSTDFGWVLYTSTSF